MTTRVQPKSTETTIDLRDDENYADTADKLAALRARAEALDRRRGELMAGLNRIVDGDRLTARAGRLLQDDAIPRHADAERDSMRKSLGDVQDEAAVVRRAVELQARVVEQETARVSREICSKLRPRHRRVVQKIATALTRFMREG
jgi:hypothetical protein